MKCEQIRQFLADAADGSAPVYRRWAVRLHLTRCPACAADYAAVSRAAAHLEHLRAPLPAPELREQLRSSLAEGVLPADPLPALRPRPRGRRIALAALPLLLVVGVAWGVLFPSPAQALQWTIDAMAHVKTAHATGSYTRFRRGGARGPAAAIQMKAEYWYAAPDLLHRRFISAEVRSGESAQSRTSFEDAFTEDLFVNGPGATVTVTQTGGRTMSQRINRNRMAEQMSEWGLFREGPMAQVARQRTGRVEQTLVWSGGRLLRQLTVWVHLPKKRTEWKLLVDPLTNRPTRLRMTNDRGEVPAPYMRLDITNFAYDVPIPAAEFQPSAP